MEDRNITRQRRFTDNGPARAAYSRAKRSVTKAFYETVGIELTDEEKKELQRLDEMETIASTKVNEPDFPIVMFLIALTVDLMGLPFFELSGFWYFVMLIVEPIFMVILFIYMFGRLNVIFTGMSKLATGKAAQRVYGRLARRYLRKYMSRRAIAILIVKIIPLISILASGAFFVFIAHNQQKKIARAYMKFVILVGNALKGHYRRMGIEEE